MKPAQDLKLKSNSAICSELKTMVSEERRVTLQILHYLREIEIRKIHLEAGFSSLFEYCVKELGYSEGSAHRRISAMRLIQEVPEAEEKIESGKLSLTVSAQARTFFKEASKKMGPISTEEKRNVLSDLENQSSRESEKRLASLLPEAVVPKEKTRPISDEYTVIQFVADRDLLEKLERLKGLLAHKNFDGNYAKLFHLLADTALREFDRKMGKHRSPGERAQEVDHPKETGNQKESENSKGRENQKGKVGEEGKEKRKEKEKRQEAPQGKVQAVNAPESTLESPLARDSESALGTSRTNDPGSTLGISRTNGLESVLEIPRTNDPASTLEIPQTNSLHQKLRSSRFIPKFIRHAVWLRDGGRCTYQSIDGRRCESKHGLQFDHRVPHCQGGRSSAQNLRLMCGAHNRYLSEKMGLSKTAPSKTAVSNTKAL